MFVMNNVNDTVVFFAILFGLFLFCLNICYRMVHEHVMHAIRIKHTFATIVYYIDATIEELRKEPHMIRFGYGGWWTWLGGLAIISIIALIIYALVVVVSRAGRTHIPCCRANYPSPFHLRHAGGIDK